MSNVLIAELCGDPNQLAQLLAYRGHGVWGLALRAGQWVGCSVEEPTPLDEYLPEHVDVLLLVAGQDPAEAFTEEALHAAQQLLAHLVARGTSPRVVFTSSTIVFSAEQEGPIDEDTPIAPAGAVALALAAMEACLTAHPFPATVLRLAPVYGHRGMPWRGPHLPEPGPIVHGALSRIHIEDVEGALLHLVDAEQPRALYLLADEAPIDCCALHRWAVGRKLRVPQACPGIWRMGGRLPAIQPSSARLRADGVSLRYPTWREGLMAERVRPYRYDRDLRWGMGCQCSFCNAPAKERERVIAGPGVYICSDCVAKADRTLAARDPNWSDYTQAQEAHSEVIPLNQPTSPRWFPVPDHCSFAHKSLRDLRYLLVDPRGISICDECLALCVDICTEPEAWAG